ncbi:30S ribosomal protein S21 [Candidatus Peregrinibacteria bacterium]|nr:MAG: 30S ribosomal protein S21 [Candidatus Peregrinibacteria bacterium]
MIYATKKSGESNERLMNRFKQVVQRSRIILKNKRGRYFEKPKTKNQVRTAAVVRAQHRTEKARKQFYS